MANIQLAASIAARLLDDSARASSPNHRDYNECLLELRCLLAELPHDEAVACVRSWGDENSLRNPRNILHTLQFDWYLAPECAGVPMSLSEGYDVANRVSARGQSYAEVPLYGVLRSAYDIHNPPHYDCKIAGPLPITCQIYHREFRRAAAVEGLRLVEAADSPMRVSAHIVFHALRTISRHVYSVEDLGLALVLGGSHISELEDICGLGDDVDALMRVMTSMSCADAEKSWWAYEGALALNSPSNNVPVPSILGLTL